MALLPNNQSDNQHLQLNNSISADNNNNNNNNNNDDDPERLRRQQWYIRMGHSRTDSPCVLAMVALTAIVLIIFVITSAVTDLFANKSNTQPVTFQREIPVGQYLQFNISPLVPRETTFQTLCVEAAPENVEKRTCLFPQDQTEPVSGPIAVSDVGSLGPTVAKHVRNMLDKEAIIRLKKVSCNQLTKQMLSESHFYVFNSSSNSQSDQFAFCVITVQIDDVGIDQVNDTSWSGGDSNRYVYATALNITSLEPALAAGRFLGIPHVNPRQTFADNPTVFTFNRQLYVAMLLVGSKIPTRPFIWDVRSQVRIEVKMPNFVQKNFQQFAYSWTPWIINDELFFIFSLLPLQLLKCKFIPVEDYDIEYLDCRLEAYRAPTLPRPININGDRWIVKDSSMFAPFFRNYHIGYAQLVSVSNASASSTGHVVLLNAKSKKIAAFSSAITPDEGIKNDRNKNNKPSDISSIPAIKDFADIKNGGTFLLFGGLAGRRGSTIRIDGLGLILGLCYFFSLIIF